MSRPEELVEYKQLAARANHPGGLGKAGHGMGDDCKNEMQHRGVKSGVGEGERLRIPLHRLEVLPAGAGEGSPEHGQGEVQPDVVVPRRQKRKVEAGADSGQQYSRWHGGEGGKTRLPGVPGGGGNGRVVKGGD